MLTEPQVRGSWLVDADDPVKTHLARTWEALAPSLLAGTILGFVVGGIGGRVAMFVLRLTSSPTLNGAKTDDDFTIGVVSSATVFLIFVCLALGVFGGIIHAITRSWIPRRVAPIVYALLAGTLGAAQILRPDGIDFTLLDPLGLAVGMFVFIPALYGALLPVLANRFETWGTVSRCWQFKATFVPFIVLLPTVIPLLVICAGVALAAIARPALVPIWRSRLMTWSGRLAILTTIALFGQILIDDVSAIL